MCSQSAVKYRKEERIQPVTLGFQLFMEIIYAAFMTHINNMEVEQKIFF